MASLKEQKELFVSGHDGTSPQELLLVCCTVPAGFLCGSVILKRFSIARARPLTLEAAALWIPMILCQSKMLYPWGVIYLFAEVAISILLELLGEKKDLPEEKAERHEWKRGSLTAYRSGLMYLTFVAILAVDFPFFPRRFAKTETHGYGLMDLGPASFVIAAGLVSPRAANKEKKRRYGVVPFRRVLPLLGMGLLRLLTLKGIEYQEHASEYGVNWNFFFTLALLPVLVACVPGPGWAIPAFVMILYQLILSQGLQEWIEHAPRECEPSYSFLCHFFAANREGVLGCVCYTSLYLISERIGWVMWTAESPHLSLFIVWGISSCAWRLLCWLGFHVSRRSTNTSFCCWALVVNLPILASTLAIHRRHGQVSLVSQAVNKHGLICFIVANLLTGAVNISINTMQVADTSAICILIAYMTAIGIFATILDAFMPSSKINAAVKDE